MKTAKIIFNDGSEMTVNVNDTTFIIEEKPQFPTDLTNIVVQTDDGNTVYYNPKVIECAMGFETGYGFIFVEKNDSDLLELLQAQIEYLMIITEE